MAAAAALRPAFHAATYQMILGLLAVTGMRLGEVIRLDRTCAMSLLAHGVDTAVIALWLGHERVETTQIYVHADMSIKERALARTTPPTTTPGRYRPTDTLLAFLDGL